MASKMDAMKAELKKVKEKRRSPTEKTMQDLRLQNQVNIVAYMYVQ